MCESNEPQKKKKQFWIKGLSTNEKTNSVRAHERRYVFPTKGNLNFKHENLDWTSSGSFTLDTSPFQRDLVNNILKQENETMWLNRFPLF